MVKVLVNFDLSAELQDRLRKGAPEGVELVFAESDEVARQEIEDAEVLFGGLNPGLLRRAKRLRWVQSSVASQENHLFPEFIASDILLTNVAGIYSEEIADHVYALILALVREIPRFVRNQERRYWTPRTEFRADYLMGKTIGVIGLGGIGGEVARRAPAFRMRVVATRAHPEQPHPEYVERVWGQDGLDNLLREADFVVICTPETPRTRRMIGSRELALMKPSAYLINIGRGQVVNLSALAVALQERRIAGAGLDVFEVEPLPADHPLWGLDNVLITPHMASQTDIYPGRRVELFLDNLSRYVGGQPLRNLVDKAEWH